MTIQPGDPSLTVEERTLERRAVEAAIWGLPIVSVDAMRQAFFRDAGANYGDIVWWSKSDWKNQTATPNASTRYIYFNFNTTNGPVVLELPAAGDAGLFGSLLDAWQVPLVDVGTDGEDQGKGGKYLLLPPSYKGHIPSGHIPVRSATYNGYALCRAIPKTTSDVDLAKAIALVKKLRLYSLAEAAKPPEQRFVDMADKLFDGIVRFDESLYKSLARMLNEEPVQTRDKVAMGQLRSLGIEKGQEFKSNGAPQRILNDGAREARAALMRLGVERTKAFWQGLRWTYADPIGAHTGFTFETGDYLDVDERGWIYFLAYAPPAKLGKASFYLCAFVDEEGQPLRGGDTYVLRVPAKVPAQQFWATTVYDRESCAFIRESPRVGLDSYDQTMRKNTDGSVDIYFGPEPPQGQESNWIYTEPGKEWFTMFRFYGPDKPLFEKTWKLPDLERRTDN